MTELESLGACIRHLLKQKGMTGEDLVTQMNGTGSVTTNKPAVSRIMTGKRIPNEQETRLLSEILDASELAEAIVQLNEYLQSHDGAHALAFYEQIDVMMRSQNDSVPLDHELLFRMVKGLQAQCVDQDVTLQVKEGFLEKLTKLNGAGELVEKLKLMYSSFVNDLTIDKKNRAWMAAALLYFISPFDLIPDFSLPFGYMDDGVVVRYIFDKFLQKY